MKVREVKTLLTEILLGKLRDKNTSSVDFRNLISKLGLILITEALSDLSTEEVKIETPISTATSAGPTEDVVFIAILRAGLSLIPATLELYPSGKLGFIGVYRNEQTLQPVPYYAKFPVVKGKYILLDPMLATGGTAEFSLNLILQAGIPEEKISFISIVSAPEGIERLRNFKKAELITAAIDEKLNSNGYIVPGLGDAGDRYCDTENNHLFELYGGQRSNGV